MASSGTFRRAADLAHKGVVTGLLSFLGFQVCQVGVNVYHGRSQTPYTESTYFKDVDEKVKDEYKKRDNQINKRDWYEADDQSYLKDQVRADITRPEFRKEYEAKKR